MFRFVFIGIVLFLTSCGSSEDEAPEGILSEEKTVKILMDIHITESLISNKNLPYDSAQFLFSHYYQEIMKKHGTDTASFGQSRRYYFSDVKKLNRIYEAVVDSLGVLESKNKLD